MGTEYEVKTYELTLQGTRPLLMEANTQVIEKASRRRKSDYHDKTEWKSRVYFDDSLSAVYFPSDWIKESLETAARRSKEGMAVGVGVAINADGRLSPVQVKDAKGKFRSVTSLDEFEKDELASIHVSNVRRPPRTGSYVTAYRPLFRPGWRAEFSVTVYDPSYDRDRLLELLELAGVYAGIGGGRDKGFGRFEVMSLK